MAARFQLDAEATLRQLAERDLIQRDPSTGVITCAYPFSGRPTPHQVHIADLPPVYAMCAVDALGIPFMLRRTARIVSHDPVSRQPIVVEVQAGQARWNPPTTVVSIGRLDAGPLVHTCCGVTHFFASLDTATAYLDSGRMQRGQVLDQQVALAVAVGMFGAVLADG